MAIVYDVEADRQLPPRRRFRASPLLVPEASSFVASGDVEVELLGLFLLHETELRLKQGRGVDALIDRLEAAELTELVEPDRVSAV